MRHAELAEILAERADISLYAATRVLQALPAIIVEQLKARQTVHIRGLGWFYPKVWRRNVVTDYRTGAQIVPPPTLTYRLRISPTARRKLRWG